MTPHIERMSDEQIETAIRRTDAILNDCPNHGPIRNRTCLTCGAFVDEADR